MFTLSAIILEDGENLFQDFWIRLVFLFFVFLRGIIKKKSTDLAGPCPTRTRPASLYNQRPRPRSPPVMPKMRPYPKGTRRSHQG